MTVLDTGVASDTCCLGLLPTHPTQEVSICHGATAQLSATRSPNKSVLDIHLPGPDGLTLCKALARLPHSPLLVFVAGSADYAVAAFQVHAADYLLKPIEARQVEELVRHLEERLSEQRAASIAPDGDRSATTPGDAVTPGGGERLPVRDRSRNVVRLLARHEIVAVLRRGRRSGRSCRAPGPQQLGTATTNRQSTRQRRSATAAAHLALPEFIGGHDGRLLGRSWKLGRLCDVAISGRRVAAAEPIIVQRGREIAVTNVGDELEGEEAIRVRVFNEWGRALRSARFHDVTRLIGLPRGFAVVSATETTILTRDGRRAVTLR